MESAVLDPVSLIAEVVVARKKQKQETPPPPPPNDPPPKPERARDRGEVVTLSVEIPPDLAEVVEEYRESVRWSKKTLVVYALETLFASKGLWPRQSKGGSK